EVLPARLKDRELELKLGRIHGFGLEGAWRERNRPEVDRSRPYAVFDDVEVTRVVELMLKARSDGDRPIALAVGRERLERVVGGLRAPAPARPVDRVSDELLRFRAPFLNYADRHVSPPRSAYERFRTFSVLIRPDREQTISRDQSDQESRSSRSS